MSELMFGSSVCSLWPTFNLPIAGVPKITLLFADPEGALALADTLPGTLEVILPPPFRHATLPLIEGKPTIFYTTILRSVSHPGNRTRELSHNISSRSCIAAFGNPALSDRVVRLTLPLAFWEDFVGLRAFGPFNALEDITLTLEREARFQSEGELPLPRLSSSRLQRLTLKTTWEVGRRTVDIGDVAKFAVACLPEAKFPLTLALGGLSLTGTRNDFPQVFSSSPVGRES